MGAVGEKNGVNGVKNGANNGGNADWKAKVVEMSRKWARQYSSRKSLWAVGSILVILSLIMVVVISRQSGKQLHEATQAVTHTREILETLQNLTAQLSEVESAARSFAISGKQSGRIVTDVGQIQFIVRNASSMCPCHRRRGHVTF